MNDKLFQKALEMRKNSHAPFSGYKVGSAIETEEGFIIGGCNVESASYGLTCCAERSAIYNAISLGYTSFRALAVVTDNGGYPCGACRQVIWEICGDIIVYICNTTKLIKSTNSSALLPKAFDSKFLE
tara:strand:+ start:2003 stop:2386 length:384 start_codon:yes stop_codon:yes gene_type:complete